jgi:acyl-CoA thioesterase FadM
MPVRRKKKNPADIVLRARLRETVHFPDLTERMALRLSSIAAYTAQAHFGIWHRKLGSPDFTKPDAVFTPLVHVELEATDVRVDPREPFHVHGETFLAKTLDPDGAVRHLVREGRHTVLRPDGAVVARARLMNVFTRYDTDVARRRVTELPAEMNIGTVPSRVTTLPDIETLVPAARRADFVEESSRVWHYGQTDANRHVNGMEYLRGMELYVADVLHAAGHDLRRLYFTRARIVYRKPCFRGEAYRRLAWFRGEAPLTMVGVFVKVDDGPDARPAAAVELELAQHDVAGESAR